MDLQTVTFMPDTERDEAWKLYQVAFEGLRAAAVQRHLMVWSEFEEVMADPRVEKYVIHDETGRLVALGTLTNDLTAVPLISPEYFERRYPEQYAAKHVWYIGFMAVHPEFRGTAAWRMLISNMAANGSHVAGVFGMDMCGFNVDTLRMPAATRHVLRQMHPDCTLTQLDYQSYWAYEFPTEEPAVAAP